MATLHELNIVDITQMSDEELLELLRTRRSDRRKPKATPLKKKSSKAPAAAKAPTPDQLSQEQSECVLKQLGEIE